MVAWRDDKGTMLPECWKRGGHPKLTVRGGTLEDTALIAAARNALPALLDLVDALEVAVHEQEADLAMESAMRMMAETKVETLLDRVEELEGES
ncbi:hypothetical protein CU669_15005 [Paramagnetospirillum kuznetsovii]|uniref:Uncharacterized protein n=2 Tax=Paramagnetospirillum kuznetsovii TaxID=2053833 RepID=A0A364NVI1_9PROT|nr:hypothetical protein CU669_15005 [Paramagnetospirillum kuznetsovii]